MIAPKTTSCIRHINATATTGMRKLSRSGTPSSRPIGNENVSKLSVRYMIKIVNTASTAKNTRRQIFFSLLEVLQASRGRREN